MRELSCSSLSGYHLLCNQPSARGMGCICGHTPVGLLVAATPNSDLKEESEKVWDIAGVQRRQAPARTSANLCLYQTMTEGGPGPTGLGGAEWGSDGARKIRRIGPSLRRFGLRVRSTEGRDTHADRYGGFSPPPSPVQVLGDKVPQMGWWQCSLSLGVRTE